MTKEACQYSWEGEDRKEPMQDGNLKKLCDSIGLENSLKCAREDGNPADVAAIIPVETPNSPL